MTNIIPTCSRQPQQEEQPGPARPGRTASYVILFPGQIWVAQHPQLCNCILANIQVQIVLQCPRLSPCAPVTVVSAQPTGAMARISFDPRSGVRAPGRAGAALGGWSCRTVDTRPAAADSQESDRRPRNTDQPRTHR